MFWSILVTFTFLRNRSNDWSPFWLFILPREQHRRWCHAGKIWFTHIRNTLDNYTVRFIWMLGISQRVRVGLLIGCPCSEDQGTQSSPSVCWGWCSTLQVGRLLFQGGSFMRRKSSHDCFHKASYPRPWCRFVPSRSHSCTGIIVHSSSHLSGCVNN